MIKNANMSTRIEQQRGQTTISHSAIENKPKPNVVSTYSRGTPGRLLSVNALNTRRTNQKSDVGSQAAVRPRAEKKSINDNKLHKSQPESEDLESRIRSDLSRNGPIRTVTSLPRPSKSVRFDPAVLFCTNPDIAGSGSTQENRFQAGLEAILKCKKSEIEKLQLILSVLTKRDMDSKKPDTEKDSKGTLNPRASIFQMSSSLPPKGLGPQGLPSTQCLAPRRKFHPRAPLDPDIFKPQTSVQLQEPKPAKTPDNKQTWKNQSPDLLESSNDGCRPLVNPPAPPLHRNIGKSLRGKYSSHPSFKSFRWDAVAFQDLRLIDLSDDTGPGREALAVEPALAQAILGIFALEYPMTGFLNPVSIVAGQSQRTAEVQQMLEFMIMQQKEMAALARCI